MNQAPSTRKALFLDRDGVIVYDAGYTRDASLIRLMPGIVELIAAAQSRGYLVLLVTNQSGIGRRRITLEEYQAVTQRMLDLLYAELGTTVDGICFAPYFEGAATPIMGPEDTLIHVPNTYQVTHVGLWDPLWRKPQLGMIDYWVKTLRIDPASSMMVGDRWTDQLLAIRYPLQRGLWFCEQMDYYQECVTYLATQEESIQNRISISHSLVGFIPLLTSA